jgi:classical protein kinase C beta type
MMFEMLAGRAPFDGYDDDELFDSILLNKPRYPSSLAKESQAVVKGVCVHVAAVFGLMQHYDQLC